MAERDDPQPGRSDLDLLRAHVAGDRDAFTELFQRHRDRIVERCAAGDAEGAAAATRENWQTLVPLLDRLHDESATDTP